METGNVFSGDQDTVEGHGVSVTVPSALKEDERGFYVWDLAVTTLDRQSRHSRPAWRASWETEARQGCLPASILPCAPRPWPAGSEPPATILFGFCLFVFLGQG